MASEQTGTLVNVSICAWDLARLKASAVLLAMSKNSIAPSQSPASWQCRDTISAPVLLANGKGGGVKRVTEKR